MAKDFGRKQQKHLWIDLDSGKHSEIWLHVFRQQLSRPVPKNLIVIEEGGFAERGPHMKVMTREEFKEEYEIDVPELFSDEESSDKRTH